MAQINKLEANIQLKSSAEEFYNILSTQIHQIPNASSDKIHTIEVHEGDWEKDGSVKLWKYTIGIYRTHSHSNV